LGADKKAKKAEEPEELPDFLDWSVDKITKLNHDCILMVLTCQNMKELARQKDVGDVWHIDFLKEGPGIGEELKRAYTPVSDAAAYRKGVLELVVKVYPNGQMTRYLAALRPSSTLLVSPPLATHHFEDGTPSIVMIAGGSAVTVALQMCKAALRRAAKSSTVTLYLCNRTVEDVLYRESFDEMLQANKAFKMVHCLSSGPIPSFLESSAEWRPGRISQEAMADTDPLAHCIVSGPMGLCQTAVNLWSRLGRQADRLQVLDELPKAPSVEDTEEPVDGAKSADMRHAHGTPLPLEMEKPVVSDKAQSGPMSFWCSVMRPFWCQAKEVDKDDSEGLPTIMVQPN